MPRYEYRQGSSEKFWDIALSGRGFTVTYGKLGAAGKSLRKEFGSEAEALVQYEKQIAGKLREGYQPASAAASGVLASGPAGTTPTEAAAAAPAAVPAAPPASGAAAPAAVQSGSSAAAPARPPTAAALAAAGRRDLEDGESVEVSGSGSSRYRLKNTGGVYSCSCPAWRNQSQPIEKRTCKHLQALRGVEAEEARAGAAVSRRPAAGDGGREAKEGPPLLLARVWELDTDLTGWWMSEKLDGVRAYWNGREIVSRLGNRLLAPEWFTAALPEHPLDGELWCGRKLFQRTVSIVRRQDRSELWREVRFVVFDAPGHAAPFEERLVFVREALRNADAGHVQPLEHQRCEGVEHLRSELERVEALGGEGLMLRRPGSLYEAGRSSSLLKVKSFRDAEARVVGHVAGAGRHKGRLGALRVEMPDGTQFSIGTGFSDAERERPPRAGSLVRYRYQELSDAGVPRFPAYLGVRTDADL